MQSPVILQINPKAPTYQIARLFREYMSADEQRQLGYLLLHGADGTEQRDRLKELCC